MLEPLGVALHAISLAGDIEGASVGVTGCGPIGLLLIAALRRSGARRIVATDPLAHRLEAAVAMGADDAWDGRRSLWLRRRLRDRRDRRRAARRPCSGRPGGRVVLIGIPDGDRTSFVASLARRKELTLVVCRRMLPGDLVRAAEMAGSGLPGLESMVTHRYPISELRTRRFRRPDRSASGLKVMIIP